MRALPPAVLILGGIVATGVAIGGVAAIAAAAVIAAVFAALAWWGGAWIVGRRLGAQPFAGGTPPALARAVAAIEAERGERIAIFRASTLLPNAVVLGGGRIVLSDGLLQTLNEAELEAVLRHLQGRAGAARGGAAIAVLLLPIVFAAALLKSLLTIFASFAQSEVEGGSVGEARSIGPVIAGVIVGPFARLLLWFGASRGAVWTTDDATAPLALQREALIRVLEKADRVSRQPIVFRTARYSLISLFWNHLFFANPLDYTPLQRFAHLPTSRARLERFGDPHNRAS